MIFSHFRSNKPGPRSAGDRRGFTLIELMVGVLVSSIVIVVAFQVLVGERRSAEARRQEMNAQQNLRVALDKIGRDIRMSGLGIDDFNDQPRVVDAGPWQMAFNADISSGVGGDPAMDAALQIKLSGGGVYSPGDYPSENLDDLPRYNGGAETVVFGLDANFDGIVDGDDLYADSEIPVDYALFRGVNGQRIERVAFGIRGPDVFPDGTLPPPLFQYWGTFGGGTDVTLWGDGNGDGELSQTEIGNITPVTATDLPNVIVVDVNVGTFTEGEVAAMAHDHGTEAEPFNFLEMSSNTRVRPRNIGVSAGSFSACGEPPHRPTGVWVEDNPNDAGSSILVHFNASSDEASDEEDVTHYFIYRREAGGSYGAAIAQVPAAAFAYYTYANDLHTPDEEDIPIDGTAYYYRVTAWDCKPQESSMSSEAGPVSSQPNGSAPPVLITAYDTPCDAGEEITLLFQQSPDEIEGTVSGYRVFRGPQGGDFLSKTLIGFLGSTGSELYTYLDNVDYNLAGAPPQNGQDYWYTVRAVNDTIVSVDSNELGPVKSSAGLSAAQLDHVQDVPFDSGTALQVSWYRSQSETCIPNPVSGYQLQRQGPIDDAFLDIEFHSSTGDPGYTVQDSGLIAGQPYIYRVMTVSIDDAEPSNEITGIPTNNNDLLPPTNVAAEGVNCDASGAIVVTWNRSFHDNGSGDMEYYRVWRRVQGGGAFGQIGEVPALALDTYDFGDNDGGPNPPVIGTTYEYVVTAYNETLGNESGYSNMTVCTASSVPDAPTLYSAVDTPNDHGGSITLLFRRSDDDGGCTESVISYNVYRSELWGEYDEDPVASVTATGTTYYTHYDNGSGGGDPPVDETPYYYMVRAWDGERESEDSNQRGPVMSLDDAVSSAIIFQDGFETDTGWTHGGIKDDWQRGDPVAKSQYYGEPDPENAYLGDDVYGNDIGNGSWNGRYAKNANNWTISPAIDCTNAINVKLVFQRWLNVEQPIYDRAFIEVSGSGGDGPWTQIWQNSVEITDVSWHEMEFDISSIADEQSDVRIRFSLDTDNSWHYAGWNIDELQIIGDQ